MFYAILSLGLLGVIASLGLGIAARKFAVEVDPKVEQINEALPQANCGGCGYAGCINFAEAVVKGEVEPNKCVAGGDEVSFKIAEILGIEVKAGVKKVAVIHCSGFMPDIADVKFEYFGVRDCRAAQIIGGGFKGCSFGCLGLGTCVSACPFDAITIGDRGLPVVNEDKCTGCGSCVKVCPRNIISLYPIDKKVRVLCSSKDKGAKVKKYCKAGCISCSRCEKICPVNAINVIDNIARMDIEKCINCGLCATVCPVKVIHDYNDVKPKATIKDDKCVGCTKCEKICPVNAISGEPKKLHIVNKEKCIGCGLCKIHCPKDAIELV